MFEYLALSWWRCWERPGVVLLKEEFEVSKPMPLHSQLALSALCLSQDTISRLLPAAVFFILMIMDSNPLNLYKPHINSFYCKLPLSSWLITPAEEKLRQAVFCANMLSWQIPTVSHCYLGAGKLNSCSYAFVARTEPYLQPIPLPGLSCTFWTEEVPAVSES